MERMTYLLIAGGLGLLWFFVHPLAAVGAAILGGLVALANYGERWAGSGSSGGGDGGDGFDGGCDGGGGDGGGGDGGGGGGD